MAYTHVLLDADDTLFDFSRAEQYSIRCVMDRAGIRSPNAAARFSQINQALWRRLEKGELSAAQLRVRRFEEFFREMNAAMPPQRGAELFIESLAKSCFVLPESLSVLQALKRRRLSVCILTNGFSAVQRSRLALSGLLPYIDQVVVSQELGLQKPDPALVDYALAKAGCADKSSAVLVGDSLSSDMAAARNAGIAAVWYNPHLKPRPTGWDFYEIHRLCELLPLL